MRGGGVGRSGGEWGRGELGSPTPRSLSGNFFSLLFFACTVQGMFVSLLDLAPSRGQKTYYDPCQSATTRLILLFIYLLFIELKLKPNNIQANLVAHWPSSALFHCAAPYLCGGFVLTTCFLNSSRNTAIVGVANPVFPTSVM